MPKHVVMFSGGVGCWAAAKRVAERYGTDDLTLLFADTGIEDEDLYRFLPEAAANVGGQLVRVADGRTPWGVFREKRFLGNTRVDLCSRILKREVLDRWRDEYCDPADTIIYLGYDIEEEHRLRKLRERVDPKWRYECPMMWRPWISKPDMLDWLDREGIRRPRLYDMGFPHNNCGGFCVKAGQAHFLHLLRTMPERFAHHERKEQELRAKLNKDVAILRDRRGGKTRSMTLQELRERHERNDSNLDFHEWGGCGCFSEDS